jgi:hypothetical protein
MIKTINGFGIDILPPTSKIDEYIPGIKVPGHTIALLSLRYDRADHPRSAVTFTLPPICG